VRMHLGSKALVFMCVVFGSACGARSSQKQASRALETLQSWTASARLAATAWRAGSTPRAYTLDTFELAQKQMDEEKQKLRSAALSGSSRADLGSHAERVQELVESLKTAVKQSNRTAIEQPVQQLAAEEEYFLQSPKHTGESSQ